MEDQARILDNAVTTLTSICAIIKKLVEETYDPETGNEVEYKTNFIVDTLPAEIFVRYTKAYKELVSISKSAMKPSLILDNVIDEVFHGIRLKKNPLKNLKNLFQITREEPKDREFLIEGVLPKVWYSIMYAAGGLGKSFVSLQMAISIATGLPFLGKYRVPERKSVILVNEEDDESEINRRARLIFSQICLENNVKESDYEKYLNDIFVISLETVTSINPNYQINLVDSTNSNCYFLDHIAGLVLDEDKTISNLGLIIFDPLNRLAAIDLNENAKVSTMVTSLRRLSTRLNCSLMLINHINKGSRSKKSRQSSIGDANSSMGAASLVNSARHTLFLDTFNEVENKIAGLKDAEEDSLTDLEYVAIRMPKANYLPPTSRTVYMHREEGGAFSGTNLQTIRNSVIKQEEITEKDNGLPENEQKILDEIEKGTCIRAELLKKTKIQSAYFTKIIATMIRKGLVSQEIDGTYKKN